MENPSLAELRKRINEVDEEIIRLLRSRMELCRIIGELKAERGLPITVPERERQVLERAGEFKRIYEEIVRLCKEVQQKVVESRTRP